MREVYLDNSASTPLLDEVKEYISYIQAEIYGNPSSFHRRGLEAEKEIELARSRIARALGSVPPEQIVFTSGGTESNNLAIKGIAYRYHRRGNHLITTSIEHLSSLNAFRQMDKEGYDVSFLQVNEEGSIDLQELKSLLRPETILVSIIHINNEVGTIQNIRQIGEVIKKKAPQAFFHVDGVQSFGKVNLPVDQYGVDLLSLSAHKIHGPKGSGSLWIKDGVELYPLFQGGDQEKGIRPGTENVAGIAGFGKAASLVLANMEEQVKKMRELKKLLYANLSRSLEVIINGPPPEEGAPHILNLVFPGMKGEVLLHALEERGIYVSTGAACHSRKPEPSHVLTALGLARKQIQSSLRFSLSSLNTPEDIEYASQNIIECVKELGAFME